MRAYAGRDHQGVVAEAGAVAQSHLAAADVQGARPYPQAQIEPEAGEMVGAAQMQTLGFPGSGEELLGQGRPVVRRVEFVADESEGAGETPAAQRFGRTESGGRRAHDDDSFRVFRVAHGVLSGVVVEAALWCGRRVRGAGDGSGAPYRSAGGRRAGCTGYQATGSPWTP